MADGEVGPTTYVRKSVAYWDGLIDGLNDKSLQEPLDLQGSMVRILAGLKWWMRVRRSGEESMAIRS